MPKTVDHDEYRKELLGKCFALFGRKGFANVTMREIAREIGASTGTLYHYFPGKESILEQMFAWAVDDNIGDYSRKARTDLSADVKLKNMAEFWTRSEEFYKNLLLLALDLFRNNPAKSEKVFHEFLDFYTAANAKSLGANRRLSQVIFNYLLGCVVHSLLTPNRFSYKDEVVFTKEAIRNLFRVAQGKGKKVSLSPDILALTSPKKEPEKKSAGRRLARAAKAR